MKWAIDAHNAVNARLHKPQLSYAQAVRAIQTTCPGDGTTVGATRGKTDQDGSTKDDPHGMPGWEIGVIAAAAVVVAAAAVVTAIFLTKRRKTS
jgi:hypothetical protein